MLKFPKFNLVKVFRGKDENEIARSRIKKEPIINNNLTDNYDVDNFDNKDNTSQTYYSPSLEILETDNSFSKTKVEEENIKTNSTLLEKVFEDFNIDIQVINVKLGPVVTLFEILPAPGIKINTIINLADDISRSMGVGAVRIAILTAPTPILLDISSARFMIVLILIPGAGNISNRVTTGPNFTLITCISMLKSSNTFSNNVEFVFIFSSSTLVLEKELSVSKISSDGE